MNGEPPIRTLFITTVIRVAAERARDGRKSACSQRDPCQTGFLSAQIVDADQRENLIREEHRRNRQEVKGTAVWAFLLLVHLVGLSLGVGAATVKLALLAQSIVDPSFAATFLRVSKPITRLIVVGLILLTLSGIGWLFLGYRFTPLLVVKILLVVAVWVLGPYIDRVVEPRFAQLIPQSGKAVSPEFTAIQRRYLVMETVATVLMYAILLIGWRL
jgi:hypothetical protein